MDEELVQSISDEATAYILNRYKRLFPYCAEGAARFKTLARKQGIPVAKVGGLYGSSQHWWCRLEDGTIVDPTAAQHGGRCGIQVDIHLYDEIPRDLVVHLPRFDYHSSSHAVSLQQAWWWWKKYINAGVPAVETRGRYLIEERVDKKGWPYLYEGRQVMFTWSSAVHLRAKVTWTKGDLSWGFVTWQRRIVTEGGKVIYPSYQRKFKELRRNGLVLVYVDGKFQPFYGEV